MNQEIKKLWIDALRSGEYKQGTGALHGIKDNTFCCLGVLCDLHSKLFGKRWKLDGAFFTYFNSTGTIPKEVADWAELEVLPRTKGSNPKIKLFNGIFASLGEVNDIYLYDFSQIANLIREQL